MHSDRLTRLERQRTRRRTILRHLTTSLNPEWIRPAESSADTHSTIGALHGQKHNGTSPGKRTRKAVERFNPSLFPPTRRPSGLVSSARKAAHSATSALKHALSHSRSIQSLGRSQQVKRERGQEQKLNDAAHASRLHAHGLSVEEFELFQYHIGKPDLESYLKVRNTMLWLWRESPKKPLTLNKALEATKDFGLHHGLIAHVFEFLLRSGYINFGACAFQDESSGFENSTQREAAPVSSGTRKTIAVVGSGIAGVAVARQLENLFRYYAWRFAPEMAPKVIVLEARSRIGGRMHSMELSTKASSLQKTSAITPPYKKAAMKHAVDLGAQIITGFDNGNPMEIIVRRQLSSDMALHYLVNETCDLFDHDGKMVSKRTDVHCEKAFNQILEQACQLRKSEDLPEQFKAYLKERQRRDGRGPGRVLSTTHPTLGHSMDFFMESHPEFRSWTRKELELIHWHYANLEFANATPLDQLSLRHWDQDDDYEFSGHHAMVVQGYGQVPVALSEGLDVRLNMAVSSIKRHSIPVSTAAKRYHHEPIQVHCRNGTSIECTAAVVTVPLGVLKSQQIKFSPPLPSWKEQAIHHLGFGLLNKLVLVFDKPFWESDIELFGYAGGGKDGSPQKGPDMRAYRSSRGKFYMFWNCMVISGLPVLVTLMAGQSAYDCEDIPQEDLVQEALETLALIYPQIRPIPTPVESVVTRWSQDEFAQGSYSFVAKEATGEDYDLLAKPVDDQLYFAGEATSRHYPATAHGAYLSGIKVAKQILDSLIGHQKVNDGSKNLVNDKARCEHSYSISSSASNGTSKGTGTRGGGTQHSHLKSMEDAHTGNSPSPHPETVSPFMSLGHGFVIPRRRGRVYKRMIAEFVAERSEDDDSDGSDNFKMDEDHDENKSDGDSEGEGESDLDSDNDGEADDSEESD